jgi:hypothetical protein
LPSPARASNSVTGELGAGMSKPTPAIPSAPFEYQKIGGRWEPSDILTLSASIRLTHDFPAAPDPATRLRTRSDWVWLGTIDATHDVSKHVAVGVSLTGSPPARRDIVAPFEYPGGNGYGLERSEGWIAGGGVDAQYDTFDEDEEHAVDTSVDVAAAYNHFASDQRMTALDANGVLQQVDQFSTSCATKTPLCDTVAAANGKNDGKLEQLRLGVTTTFTVADRTDVGLDASYYVYDRGNPTEAGFFTYFVTNARGRDVGTSTYGAGMPFLPARWSLRPEVGHRFDAISLRAYYQFTSYAVEPSEVGHTIGGKAQLYLGSWRPYLTGSYRADVEQGAAGASSWTIGIGLQKTL